MRTQIDGSLQRRGSRLTPKRIGRSVQCALDLQKWNGIYQKEDLTLSCHIGISAGQLSCIHVGGVDGRWEFLVAGEPLKQLESAVDAGKSGDVVLSPQAWALVKASFLCTKLDSGDYLATAYVHDGEPHESERL